MLEIRKLVINASHYCRRKLTSYKSFFLLFFAFAAVFTCLLIGRDKGELVPQLWVSFIAVCLTYWACLFTKEKFRLDLLDKRFEIYERTLEFCGLVTTAGTLHPKDDDKGVVLAAIQAAEKSFRGIGYHKARALFGPEVSELFEKLNNSYAYLSAFGNVNPSVNPRYADVPEKICGHLTFIFETSGKLPEYFRPYVYFGDYKRD